MTRARIVLVPGGGERAAVRLPRRHRPRRWIVDDYKMGEFRRRRDAVRAARRAGLEAS